MSKQMKNKRLYAALILSGFIGTQIVPTVTMAQEQTALVKLEESTQVSEDARYLGLYFNIEVLTEDMTQRTFVEALEKIVGEVTNTDARDAMLEKLQAYKSEEAITYKEAVRLAVIVSNFEELALVYNEEKVAVKGLDTTDADAVYIACAMDTGLIDEEAVENLEGTLTIEEAETLLMAVVEANGLGRNFLGYTDDASIYAKVNNAFQSAILFENDKLEAIGGEAVKNGVTTGYNLINTKYSANFLPELTLRYGHSTINHATQLIGLLNSEGIVAKVQLEPKTSIFEYLPEWGPVPPATPDYRVEVVSDELMLANSLEYDLVFEFETEEDKLKFDAVVETYAKKNDDNLGEGLLLASWWQPLYVSTVEMGEGYEMIYNNVITDGDYTLNPFALVENKEAVYEGLTAIDETIEVDQVAIWCNSAFYRYLSGTSHQ